MTLPQAPRQASLQRHTRETQLSLTLGLDVTDATPANHIATPLPFFNHMLDALATHGQLHLHLEAQGDIHVDPHHLVEDVGIVFGQALVHALGGSMKGILRSGCFSFPMDGTLATVALDCCGRGNLVWNVPPFESATVGTLDPRLFREFFKGIVDGAALTLHAQVPYRDNDHHVVEALCKAFARALRQALTPLPNVASVMSTKGMIQPPPTLA
jgi:imidazoleglycerol-phosphate dehydratase